MTRFELFCQYVRELQETLNLQQWDIHISEEELPKGTYAQTYFYCVSKSAWIQLGTQQCDQPYIDEDGEAVFPPCDLKQMAAHEMFHLVTAEIFEVVHSILGGSQQIWHFFEEANERASNHMQVVIAERMMDDTTTND